MEKPIVLYHQLERMIACDDGWGAAFIAMLKFGKEGADYVPVLYREKPLPLEAFQGRDVYFLDCTYKPEYMDDINIVSKSLTVLDHHETSIKAIGDREYFKGSYEMSGALLSWHFFFPGKPVPLLFYHIDDNDRWVHKDPYSKAFMERVRTFPKTFEAWSTLFQEVGTDKTATYYQNFIKEGLVLLESLQTKSAIYADQAFPIRLAGHDGLAVCCNRFFESTLGDVLAEKAKYAVIFYFITADTVSVSLRSNGFNVEPIARHYGGGGHVKAAGFSISRERWISILAGTEESANMYSSLLPIFDELQFTFQSLPIKTQTLSNLIELVNERLDVYYPQFTGAHADMYGTASVVSADLDHLYFRTISKLKVRFAKLLGLPVFEVQKKFYHSLLGYSVETPTAMSDFTVKELLNTFTSVAAERILQKSVETGYMAHLPQPYKEYTVTVHFRDHKFSHTFRSNYNASR